MLIAGADVAGNKTSGEHRIIAFVVGTEESTNQLYKKIGLREIHMSKLSERDRKRVIDNLEFNDGERFAFSLIVEKNKTVHITHERMKKSDVLFDIKLIFQHFDVKLFDSIQAKIQTILDMYGIMKRDLLVECEGDMRATIRVWRMNLGKRGRAYELADAIAWCCNNNKKVKGIIKKDLVKVLQKQMVRDFKN
ncbi:MAG: hypothetical protein KGH83_05235 [Thaumarchaeota archaeon]|nr:hypothetical protein [Nitrososphaerota archaeon]